MTLRKIDSDLEGHPTPRLNFVDVATGSLGQGLSVAAGIDHYNLIKRKNDLLKKILLSRNGLCRKIYRQSSV
jgi:transketolase N-terminal domain/subunit